MLQACNKTPNETLSCLVAQNKKKNIFIKKEKSLICPVAYIGPHGLINIPAEVFPARAAGMHVWSILGSSALISWQKLTELQSAALQWQLEKRRSHLWDFSQVNCYSFNFSLLLKSRTCVKAFVHLWVNVSCFGLSGACLEKKLEHVCPAGPGPPGWRFVLSVDGSEGWSSSHPVSRFCCFVSLCCLLCCTVDGLTDLKDKNLSLLLFSEAFPPCHPSVPTVA